MKWLTVFLCVVLSTSVMAQEAERPLPTVQEVTQKLDDLYRSKSSKSMVTMEVLNDRGKRTLELEQWSRGKDESLIVIRSPAREAGTATLKNKEGLWNYAPRADRMIRVPSGMLSDAWMGSHMTNDDLVRESEYDEDFKTTVAWVKEGGKTYLKATMTPLPKAPVVWEKIEYFLDADDWFPIRADYFDRGKMMRRMEFKDVRDVGGRKVPFVMTLLPLNKPGEHTTFKYSKLEFDVEIDSNLFSKQGLRRAAKSR